MSIKSEDFFREVTLRICSSLDIRTAIRRSFEYFQTVIPVDELYLVIRDTQLGALRHIAHASASATPSRVEIIPIPKHLWEVGKNLSEPRIIDPKTNDPFEREMSAIVGRGNRSDLIVPLCIENKHIGVLVFRSKENGSYQKEHVELIRLIMEPFALALSNALAHEEVLHYRDILLDDNRFLQRELSAGSTDDIIAAEGGLRNVMEMVCQVAPLNSTVLLLGETGVGKEVIANTIHFKSERCNGPFIKVNCGAIPEMLIDSELFGHEKGAFTGALNEKRGRFERANGGTIFLDEIGELPLEAQVRLLRVLQNREVERVGGTKSIQVDIRVIAATHRNLEQLIAENLFREDLWYRLNTFPIFIPPLRQRRDDIPALTRHFVKSRSLELGISFPPSIAPGALDRLTKYDWPGNVRELQNVIERELILYRSGPLTFESLSTNSLQKETMPRTSSKGAIPDPANLDEVMALHIRRVLECTNNRINGQGGASELLGINPNTLRSRMKKLGMKLDRSKP